MKMNPEDIVNFWIYEVGRERWFLEDSILATSMCDRFIDIYEQAASHQLDAWKQNPEGTLALLLLLNEFPRRMFRGTSRAFATDEDALEIAREAIIKHFDDRIDRQYKMLFYLPFLNSESIGDQRLALFYIRERAKEEQWLSKAEQHFEIVQRFGRFPERNPILGREPTDDEIEFMRQTAVRSLA